MKENEPYRGHVTRTEYEREIEKAYGHQTEELRRYAEMGRGQRGVGLIIQRPRLLPMSAIAKMSGHLLIAKGASVKELEKFIKEHRDPIVSACIQWFVIEVDKL